jgi:hypothetical protein
MRLEGLGKLKKKFTLRYRMPLQKCFLCKIAQFYRRVISSSPRVGK